MRRAFAGGALGLVLFLVFMRTFRGTLIPLLSAVVTGIWALGIASLLGFNFDPLSIVLVPQAGPS